MKYSTAVIGLMITCANSWAAGPADTPSSAAHGSQWKKITTDDESIIYFDPTTRKQEGPYMLGWFLSDFKSPQNGNSGNYSSEQKLLYVNCDSKKIAVVEFRDYTGRMGRGKVEEEYKSTIEKRKDTAYTADPASADKEELAALCAK